MKLLSFVFFQLGWFACVLGGAHGLPFLGSAVALLIVALHVSLAHEKRTEIALVVVASLLGALSDSLWVALGLVRYTSGTLIEGTAPVWIVAMWALFATTLTTTFAWLRGRVVVATLLGAAAGPLAYRGGASLGAAELIEPTWRALASFALTWGLAMPLLVEGAAFLSARVHDSRTGIRK